MSKIRISPSIAFTIALLLSCSAAFAQQAQSGASNAFIGCSSNVSNAGTLKYVQQGVSP